jgi:hypothetical protein
VCLLEDGKLEWATELVKTLPGLLEAGHHTADTKYEAPTGRYVPSHEPGPQMSLRSTPCAVSGTCTSVHPLVERPLLLALDTLNMGWLEYLHGWPTTLT